MFWLSGSLGGKPDARPITTGRRQWRPPSTERAAMIVAGPLPPSPLVSTNTLSSERSRLTRVSLLPGQELDAWGS